MEGNSLTPQQIKLEELKKILPEAFSEGKVDREKLKATLGEDVNFENERYVLNWAGKSQAFKTLQTPTTKTLKPAKDESVDFDNTEHVFIEGENLEVLKILQKSYFGKVKMIYIDPPYNTGNDSFIYPDKFSETLKEYQQRVGDKDAEGYLTKDGMFKKNAKENGQYHSNWLNMMFPRLFLAKNLLKDDGVIFVSIDDNEVHNLRLLMNEVFGEENFIGEFVWKRRASSAMSDNNVSSDHEYVLSYHKGNHLGFSGIKKDYKKYQNPDNDIRGAWVLGDLTVGMTASMRPNQAYGLIDPKTGNVYNFNPNRVWAFIPESMDKMIKEGRVIFPKDISKRPMQKRFKKELKSTHNSLSSILIEKVGLNTEATKLMQGIFGGNIFEYSKPLSLLSTIIPQVCNDSEIVLDFFAGSSVTAHAVMEINAKDGGNRQCISVQLPELTDEKSEAFKAGYKTIADIAKERIRRAAQKIQTENPDYQGDLGFKVLKLADSNFKQWQPVNTNVDELTSQIELFVDPIAKDASVENMVYELLLKSGKDLNAKIVYKDNYYLVNEKELVFMLEQANQDIVDAVLKTKPLKVIALDKLFNGNDQLKTNTALQFKDAGIEFRTI